MNNWADQKAFEFASDSAKHFMSLAVAILALSAASNIVKDARRAIRGALAISWALYTISFLFGTWFLLALTATVGREVQPNAVEGMLDAAPATITMSKGTRLAFHSDATPVSVTKTNHLPNGEWIVVAKAINTPSIWSDNLRIAMGGELLAFVFGTL